MDEKEYYVDEAVIKDIQETIKMQEDILTAAKEVIKKVYHKASDPTAEITKAMLSIENKAIRSKTFLDSVLVYITDDDE